MNGKIGIGTSSPASTLHIQSYASAAIRFNRTGSNDFGYEIGGTTFGLYDYSVSEYRWRTNNGNVILNETSGNVGIGTDIPTATLDIVALQPSLRIRGTLDANESIKLKLDWGTNDASGLELSYHPNLAVGFIDNKYQNVAGTVYGDIQFRRKIAGSMLASLIIKAETGNLGIGTMTPSAKLEIVDDEPSLRIRSTNVNKSTRLKLDYGINDDAGLELSYNPQLAVGFIDNKYESHAGTVYGDIQFRRRIAGSMMPSMIIKAETGNIGIGTTTPSEKLSVDGTVLAKKVRVSITGWPDYVFNPKYKLRSLSELESYIQVNQHLPEVPSAKEVEANGLDLGDMDATLLKKVEELTLYMIELNKTVKEQGMKIKALEKENQELKRK